MKKICIFITLLLCYMMSFCQIEYTQEKKDSIYASNFSTDYDKYENIKTFTSPTLDGVDVSKIIKNGVTTIYICLVIYDNYCTYGNGVIILLDDGTKITRANEKIDMDVSIYNEYGDFRYMAFFKLTQDEINKLKNKTIQGFKLYIFDHSVDFGKARDFKGFMNALKLLK